jgi:putative DNA primase/helicase
VNTTLDYVRSKFNGVKRNGANWMALCPAHPDKNPSLSISEKDGAILLHCFAGCATEDVCQAAGIELRELYEQNGECQTHKRKAVQFYDYTDGKGEILFQVVRYEPKDFWQRKPNGRGGWSWNVRDVRRVLYHLPDILKSNEVFVVEGEKDVETARGMGLCATTSAGGANAPWLPEYTDALRGKHVVIIADADALGRKKARAIATASFGIAESIHLTEMPDAKDLMEWIEKGGTREQFDFIASGVPEWKPEQIEGNELSHGTYDRGRS